MSSTNAAEQNALLSVYDKTGIEGFAKGLIKLNWKLYASGGTAKYLQQSGVPVTDVAELVGGKAILGHRVVTLSREIHAGLLANQDDPEQLKELRQLNIPLIDLVCVDLYPLEEEIAKPNAALVDVIEKTDIGGPALLRSAAKGRRIVISNPEQRSPVLEWLESSKPNETEFVEQLAARAEYEAARYIFTSAQYLNDTNIAGIVAQRVAMPKYGENPWQLDAGFYADNRVNADPLSLDKFERIQGTEPSLINYTDVDRLLQTMTHIAAAWDINYRRTPVIAVGCKHGNVCGVAVNGSAKDALIKMLEGDPRAIFGGVVMINAPLDKELVQLLMTYGMEKGKRILDGVIAPSVTADALESMQRKGGKLRVLTNPVLATLDKNSLDTRRRFRYVRGGLLEQPNYTFVLDLASPQLQKFGSVTKQQEADMLLAWAIGSTSTSNTITLVKNDALIGNGVGQQDRVGAAELAVRRAQVAVHSPQGAAAYSDSFFPFPDGPEVLAKAGVKAILCSSGSVNDKVVIDSIQKAGLCLYMIPDSIARGFYAH